jgi:hypothetical protein
MLMYEYQMAITTTDPNRWLPGAWRFEVASKDPEVVWATAQEIATREKVQIARIVDSRGKSVKY